MWLAAVWREQSGSSEAISFLGLMPFVLLTILAVLQITAFGYTLVVTESAARDAARAASKGDSPYDAAMQVSLGTGVRLAAGAECPTGDAAVTVHVLGQVPRILPGIQADLLQIHRVVTVPREENCP